ncbi:hypothetical protein ACROYT_G033585 [Oculina patagonica]
MVSKTVSLLLICLMVFTGMTEAQNNPVQSSTKVCHHKGVSYPVDELVPSEDCTMLCICNEDYPPSPCFPMCPPVRVPDCKEGEEWYSFYEKNSYGCLCEKTACGKYKPTE